MQEQVITTKNVKDSINEYVKRLDRYDFVLAQYATYLYDSNTGEFNNNISEKNINEDIFLHPDMRIGQEYTIIINEYDPEEEMHDKLLDVKLTSSKDMCEVYADITLNQEIPYTQEDIFSQIVMEINKKKAYYGVLVSIFDECMFEVLSLKVEELMKTMSVRMLVAKSHYRAKDTQKFEIQRVFLENRKNINSQFIQTFPGKILLRITPYVKGVGGRSCFGKYLYFQDYEQDDIPTITYNPENIEVITDAAGKMAYMAKKSGLVDFENNYMDVKDSVMLSQISQTKTGDVELDSVNVFVKSKDELDDAVDNGAVVESERLDVDTMVGAGAKVKAGEVNINAATHSTSEIEADIARIKIHKGKLKANKAEIGWLEHGYVEAKDVSIEMVVGGEVLAESVHIKSMRATFSHITAHKKIVVENVVGDSNVFCIKYGFSSDEIPQIDELKKKIEYLGNDITKINSSVESNKKFFASHKYKIDEIVKMSKESLSIGQQKVAQAAIATKNLITELETKKGVLQNQRDSLQKKLNQFSHDIFRCEVVVGACDPGNVIEFVVFNQKKDQVIRYVTVDGDSDYIFTLSEGYRILKERK